MSDESRNEKKLKKKSVFTPLYMFFGGFFLLTGALVTFLSVIALLVVGVVNSQDSKTPKTPSEFYLSFVLKDNIVETAQKPSLDSSLFKKSLTLEDIITGLKRAEQDDRVKAFAVKLENPDLSLAQIQELRDAVTSFQQAGKKAYIYADSYEGMGGYYLASAFQSVWLQPVGIVSITGISSHVPFVRDMLDKIGVYPDFDKRGQYKSAGETLTSDKMSEGNREQLAFVVNDLADQMMQGMATRLEKTDTEIKELVDGAPYTDRESLAAGLVNRLGYEDEIVQVIKQESGAKDRIMFSDYIHTNGFPLPIPKTDKPQNVIATVFATGTIVSYGNDMSGAEMVATDVVQHIQKAIKDDRVKAIVLRLDTPGGSPTASETIHRALVKAKAAGKPVVISMGGVVASGGYWVSAAADKIVAQPATITGSIGVFGGKMVLSGLWEKIGVNWESVSVGDHADIWSPNSRFSASEKARYEAVLDSIYQNFLDRVAQGRGLDIETVKTLAEGKIYTGRQAQDVGLVDDLGGLDKAVAVATELAGLTAKDHIVVKRFPPEKTTIERVISLLNEGVSWTPTINVTLPQEMQSLLGGHPATQMQPVQIVQ